MRNNKNLIQEAIVKDNRDPLKNGRLKVWIDGSTANENDKSGWITCDYASIFSGRSRGSANANKYQEFPKSYGFWGVPPDIGTRVFIFYTDGNTDSAYWFACASDDGMNVSIPETSSKQIPRTSSAVPVTEYDRNTPTSNKDNPYIDIPLLVGLIKQQLLYDDELGLGLSSAARAAPSTVYGMKTPRGSSITLDDGYTDRELKAGNWDTDTTVQNTEVNNPVNDLVVGSRKNEQIRLRTRSGAQILISETNGNIFIVNRDGTGRLEITPEGKILILADDTVSVRSKKDLDFIAERDINMTAFRNMNFSIGNDLTGHVKNNRDITVSGSDKLEVIKTQDILIHDDVTYTTNKKYDLYSKSDMKIKTDTTLDVFIGGKATLKSSGFDIKSGSIKMDSTLEVSKTIKTINVGCSKVSTGSLVFGGAGGVSMALQGRSNGDGGINTNLYVTGNIFATGDISTSVVGLNSLFQHTHVVPDPEGPWTTEPAGDSPTVVQQPTYTDPVITPDDAKESSVASETKKIEYHNVKDITKVNPEKYISNKLKSSGVDIPSGEPIETEDVEILNNITQDVFPIAGKLK